MLIDITRTEIQQNNNLKLILFQLVGKKTILIFI